MADEVDLVFDDDAHREGYETVCAYLRVLELPVVPAGGTHPTLWLIYSDAPSLAIFVTSWQGTDALVTFMSYLVKDFVVAADSLAYVMRQNDGNIFGWYALDEDSWLTLNYQMLASDLGRESFQTIIHKVTNAAAADDFIRRFGGRRHGAWAG